MSAETPKCGGTTSVGTWNASFCLYALDGAFADCGGSATCKGLVETVSVWTRCEVPYDAVIRGIVVGFYGQVEDTCTPCMLYAAVSGDGGTTWSAYKGTTLGNTLGYYEIGDSGELWPKAAGLGSVPTFPWTPEIFNNQSSLQVRFYVTYGSVSCVPGHAWNAFVDYVYVIVYYQLLDAPHPMRTIIRGIKA